VLNETKENKLCWNKEMDEDKIIADVDDSFKVCTS
jgi:hypothetical protein